MDIVCNICKVARVNEDVCEVITHTYSHPVILNQLIKVLSEVGERFNGDVPVRVNGVDITNLSTDICKDKDGYYINIGV